MLSHAPFGALTIALYAGGIAAAGWAGALTSKVMRGGGGDLPIGPWSIAFVLIIGGMLALIYTFFFRAREVRLTDDEVKIAIWDGSGKAIRKAELEGIEVGKTRVVVRGGGRTLLIDSRYQPWDALRAALEGWAAAGQSR